jgi:hypothetical protein
MRALKTLLAGISLLAFASIADAQTIVRITGSTAFRGATLTAIKKIFDVSPAVVYGYTGTSETGAGKSIYKGNIGGTSVTIKTSWSGAVGGMYAVVTGDTTVQYLEDGGTTIPTLTTGGTASIADNSSTRGPAGTASDVCMLDHFQSTTPFTSPTLTTIPVGVIAFKWIANNGAPSGLSNMTPQLAQALYGAGQVSLVTFTGNVADTAKLVWALGRDADSGTRLQTHQESGIGYNSQVTQWTATASGGAVTSHVLAVNSSAVPAAIQALHPNPGDGGYNSGSSSTGLASIFKNTTPNALNDGNSGTAFGFYVGYAGIADADGAIAGGAKELTWNGVSYSVANVREGKYTFWGYEALGYQPTLSGTQLSVANALANQIINVDAPDPKLNTMNVIRSADGGLVTHN